MSKIRSANFAKARQAKLDKLKAKKAEQVTSYNVPEEEEDYTYDYESYDEEEEEADEEPEEEEVEEEPVTLPTPTQPKAKPKAKAKAKGKAEAVEVEPQTSEIEELRKLVLGLTKKQPKKKAPVKKKTAPRKSNRTTINIVNPSPQAAPAKAKDNGNDFIKNKMFLHF